MPTQAQNDAAAKAEADAKAKAAAAAAKESAEGAAEVPADADPNAADAPSPAPAAPGGRELTPEEQAQVDAIRQRARDLSSSEGPFTDQGGSDTDLGDDGDPGAAEGVTDASDEPPRSAAYETPGLVSVDMRR